MAWGRGRSILVELLVNQALSLTYKAHRLEKSCVTAETYLTIYRNEIEATEKGLLMEWNNTII